MTDLTPTTAADVIATALVELEGVPDGATFIAEAIERAFLLIPRTQLEQVQHPYELPLELVEDALSVQFVHSDILVKAIANAMDDGLLIVSRPERRGGTRFTRYGMVPFSLHATGWRHPTPTGDTP